MARNNTNHSIADLRIYQLALELEDKVYKMAKSMPVEQFDLANDLRRCSAGVAHFIYESYQRYSYSIKIESLHAARTKAESIIKLLEEHSLPSTKTLIEDYTSLIKQTWGLIKYLQQRQSEQALKTESRAKDELVTSRQ